MKFANRKIKHHHLKNRRIHRPISMESFITSYMFQILGIIILFIGGYYLLNYLNIKIGFDELILRLFQSSNGNLTTSQNTEGFNATIIYYFLPGYIILVISRLTQIMH